MGICLLCLYYRNIFKIQKIYPSNYHNDCLKKREFKENVIG